jgi:hypothetical protein
VEELELAEAATGSPTVRSKNNGVWTANAAQLLGEGGQTNVSSTDGKNKTEKHPFMDRQ